MNKHLKLKDILPYFTEESEDIQIYVNGNGSCERWDEFSGNSPLLAIIGNSVDDNYYISDMSCISKDTIRIMLSRREPLAEMYDG